jgi:polar amino acid transport system substrate-binding protein
MEDQRPGNGKGFEAAVAYAVAQSLGFSRDEVEWTYTPFNKAFAPGRKSFDFDINQISFTPARAKVVGFSASYYDVNQSIVVLKGKPIAKVRSRAGLRDYKLGAQLGTTSYQYIVDQIRPSSKPAVFPRNDAAIQALKNGQIDGLVVDLPTAFFVTAVQVPNGKILGQFPTVRGGERFGMVFARGNPLVQCVNNALKKLRANGALKRIQQQWLAKATGAPVLQ